MAVPRPRTARSIARPAANPRAISGIRPAGSGLAQTGAPRPPARPPGSPRGGGTERPTTGTPRPPSTGTDVDLEEGGRLLEYAFENNVMPSFEAAPQQVRTMAGYISRLYQYAQETSDAEMLDFAIEARSRASEIIPEDIAKQYGLDEIEVRESDANFLSRMKDTALNAAFGDHPIGRFTSAVMEVADRPSQGVLTGISAGMRGDAWGAAQRVSQGLTFGAMGDDKIQEEYDRWDLDNDGILNLREALHKDPEAGGRWLGALDTVGVAIMDPTTYLGVGAAQRARAGLAAVAATQGDEAVRLVARRGIGALDDRARTEVQEFIRDEVAEAAARGRRNSTWARAQLRAGRKSADDLIEDEAARRMRNIETPTGSLRVGGANVNVPGVERARDAISGVRKDARAFRRFDGDSRLAQVASAEGAFDSAEQIDGMLLAVDRQLGNSTGGRTIAGTDTTFRDGTVWITKRGDDGELQGYLNFNPETNKVDMIAVGSDYRGQGVNHELYDELAKMTPEGDATGILNLNREGGLTDQGRRSLERYLDERGVNYLEQGALRTEGLGDNALRRAGDALSNERFGVPTVAKGVKAAGRTADAVATAFSPRRALKRGLGDYAEEVFDRARVRAGSEVSAEISDMLRRMDPVMRRAAKEAGSLEAADDLVRRALEVRPLDEVADLSDDLLVKAEVDDLIARGMPDTANYLQTMSDIRTKIDNAALNSGLDPDSLRRGYFPRTLTSKGKEVISDSEHGQQLLGIDGARIGGKESRFQQPRTFRPELSVEDANRELVAELNRGLDLDDPLRLADDEQLFEHSVAGAFATRGDAAFKASAQFDMLQGLTEEFVGEGPTRRAMVQKVEKGAEIPNGYRAIDEISGQYVALKEVADEIENVRGWMTNDAALKRSKEIMDEWSSIWGAYATTPLLDGLGFHSRNALGNVMLNAIGGVVNPAHYRRALNIQQDIGRVFRKMDKDGIDFDAALDAAVSDESRRGLIRSLREEDIVGAGWFDSLDATDDSVQQVRRRARDGKGRRLYDEFGAEGSRPIYDRLINNRVIGSGRQLGSAIEHNARIAHFIAKLDAPGGTVASAARSTRKFLFDYGDLTQFERSLRNASRFYTFMRKNTGAQLHTLARNPGRIVAAERATKGGLGALGFDEGMLRPDYSEERGDTLDLGGILGIGGDGLVGQVESPFGAALETLRPLGEAAAIIGGGGSGDDLLDSLLDLTAGGPAALVETVFSQQSGYHYGFDREMTDTEKGKEATVRRWVEAIAGPAWSQLDSFTGRLSAGEGVGPLGNNASKTVQEFGPEMAVLSNILGLNTAKMETDADAVKDEYYLLTAELEGLLQELAKDGKDVPTIGELREAGLIPEAITRATSVTTQERLDQEDDPAKRAELQADLDEILSSESERGVRIAEDGSYTTRESRGHDLAETLGIYVRESDGTVALDDDGQPKTSVNNLTRAAYNQQNPDDPFLKEDGTPVTYHDVDVEWPRTSTREGLDWLRAQGWNVEADRTRWNAELRRIFNENRPQDMRPALSLDEIREQGIRPIQGVYTFKRDDDSVVEVWPEGMSADNWWVEGSGAGALEPRSGSTDRPTTAPRPTTRG